MRWAMKETKIYKIYKDNIDEKIIKECGEALKKGKTVVFPTETVYGLGGNIYSEDTLNQIYQAKGRPSDNPLIVHICNLSQLEELVEEVPENAKILIDKYWPGPLTIIFKKNKNLPDYITRGLDTVAVRMPSNPIALKLLEECGVPVAAPSANTSGKPSPTRGSHVVEDLKGKVDVIIDGGSSKIGLESTVIDVYSKPLMILRPGGVTLENICKDIKNVIYDPSLMHSSLNGVPKSPGQKYKHYSPEAELYIFTGDIEKVREKIKNKTEEMSKEGKKVLIMTSKESVPYYDKGIILKLGSREDYQSISSNIFRALRKADELKVDIILSESFEEKGLGKAIMNRLIKASGHNIIECGE
jgi:L-threonylcarbamoyladenylate synthase